MVYRIKARGLKGRALAPLIGRLPRMLHGNTTASRRTKPYTHSAINLVVETLHRNDLTNQRQSFIPHYSSPLIQDNLTLLTFY